MSAGNRAEPGSLAAVEAELTAPGQPFEMAVAEIGGIRMRVWKNAHACVADLVEGMRKYADRTYLVYEDERLTYAEAHARIAVLAQRLRNDLGVLKGDRVAIALRNYPEWPLAFYASLSIGA